jgi:hypothetical protein
MKSKQHLALITVLFCFQAGVSAHAQQNQNELKQRILADAQSVSADDYAFTRTIRSETNSNGKTEKKVLVEKFDPTKPADARWTLVSVDGAAPSADALKSHQKEAAKRRVVPGYHRLATYFASPATPSESGNKTVFRFTALPKGSISILDTDVSQNATAEASVGDANGMPFIEQVRFTVKPMRVKLLMKIDRFETTARYRIGPGGKPFLMESSSDMSGSGMGQEGTMRNTTTYSDYRAVR